MPRKKWKIPDRNKTKIINCYAFSRTDGNPECAVLTLPWCLIPDSLSRECPFRQTRAQYENARAEAKERLVRRGVKPGDI